MNLTEGGLFEGEDKLSPYMGAPESQYLKLISSNP